MPREKELYRFNLDRLDTFTDGEVLSYEQLAKFLGKSKSTIQRHWKKHYNKVTGGISKAIIARELS